MTWVYEMKQNIQHGTIIFTIRLMFSVFDHWFSKLIFESMNSVDHLTKFLNWQREVAMIFILTKSNFYQYSFFIRVILFLLMKSVLAIVLLLNLNFFTCHPTLPWLYNLVKKYSINFMFLPSKIIDKSTIGLIEKLNF